MPYQPFPLLSTQMETLVKCIEYFHLRSKQRMVVRFVGYHPVCELVKMAHIGFESFALDFLMMFLSKPPRNHIFPHKMGLFSHIFPWKHGDFPQFNGAFASRGTIGDGLGNTVGGTLGDLAHLQRPTTGRTLGSIMGKSWKINCKWRFIAGRMIWMILTGSFFKANCWITRDAYPHISYPNTFMKNMCHAKKKWIVCITIFMEECLD